MQNLTNEEVIDRLVKRLNLSYIKNEVKKYKNKITEHIDTMGDLGSSLDSFGSDKKQLPKVRNVMSEAGIHVNKIVNTTKNGQYTVKSHIRSIDASNQTGFILEHNTSENLKDADLTIFDLVNEGSNEVYSNDSPGGNPLSYDSRNEENYG